MKKDTKLTPAIIGNFIENKLKRKLKRDQQELKILSEGDLQSCVYYNLRKYCIKDTSNWFILNKLFIKSEKVYPDIAIGYLNNDGGQVYPKILIEIKETVKPLSDSSFRGFKKDYKKLSLLMTKEAGIKKAYFILGILPNPSRNEPTSKDSPFFDSDEVEKRIKQMVVENKLFKKIKLIVINTQTNKTPYQDYTKFKKKHGLLRKYIGKDVD